MMKRVDITFVDKSRTISIPMSSYRVPDIGHRIQLHTGPPAHTLPEGGSVGHNLEVWKVVNITWDSWMATAEVEVRRCRR